MRRAKLQKVNFAPFHAVGNEGISSDARQGLLNARFRAHTSATVIGIALSIGVTGIPVPYKNRANAAEPPIELEPFAIVTPSTFPATSIAEISAESNLALSGAQISTGEPVSSTVITPSPLAVSSPADNVSVKSITSTSLKLEPSVALSPFVVSPDIAEGLGQEVIPSATIQSTLVDPASTTVEVFSPSAVSPSVADTPAEPIASPLSQSPVLEPLPTGASLAVSTATEARIRPVVPLPASQSPGVNPATSNVKERFNPSIAASMQLEELEQLDRLTPHQPMAVNKKLAESVIDNLTRDRVSPDAAYQVKPGDTLETIAANYQVPAQELVDVNRLANPDMILAGQVLKIFLPETEYNRGDAATPATTLEPAGSSMTSGETVIQPLVTSTSSLEANLLGISPATRVPKSISTPSPNSISTPSALNREASVPPDAAYQVKPGNTLETIAANYQVPAQELVNVNKLANPDLILAGQVLKVPSPQIRSDSELTSLPGTSSGGSDSWRRGTVVIAQSSTSVKSPGFSAPAPNLLQPQTHNIQKPGTHESTQVAARTLPQQNTVNTVPISEPYVAIVKRTVLPQLSGLELPPLAGVDTYLPTVPTGGMNGSGRYVWPAKGVLTSGYGPRWGRMHRGIDIAAPVGTPVAAAAPGVVVASGWNYGGYGNLVEIRHSDGSLTLYAHNNRVLARAGQQVNQGQQIAEMGSTGRSTGPHLHFEIHPMGKGAVNPVPYLGRRG